MLKPGYSLGGDVEYTLRSDLARLSATSTEHFEGTDEYWMRQALLEGMKGVGLTNPNPSVGCILVKDGVEISRGHTERFGGRHAERVAVDRLRDSSRLHGATAYVTLEPCSHFGRQPPCAELLAQSGITRVVVATQDNNPLVGGKGIDCLKSAGKKVELGLLGREASAFNLPFLGQHRLKRPVVALKWAQTLDGQLADDLQYSKWITGDRARSYTHWLRQRYDAILVGAGTYLADKPALTARDCAQPIQSQPLRIIADPRGRLFQSPEVSFKNTIDHPFVILTTEAVSKKYAHHPIRDHARVIVVPRLSLDTPALGEFFAKTDGVLSEELGRPFQSVLVEGGPSILSYFMKEDCADILHVFVSSKITGGVRNRICRDRLLERSGGFKLISRSELGQDTLLELVSDSLQGVF